MVLLIEAAWGGMMIVLMLGILYFNYHVLTQFGDDPELAATRIFLQGRTPFAFKLFAFGITCYGLTALVGVLTLSLDPGIYRLITKAGSLIMFGTWVVFMQQMAAATRKPDEASKD